MAYSIYKLKFSSGIHIGDPAMGQESSRQTIRSDMFLSALCSEYIRIFGDDELKDHMVEGKIKISELLPYKNEDFFVPKPFVAIDREISQTSENKIDRKKVKALQYIPTKRFNEYIKFLKTGENFPEDIDENFGIKQLVTKNQISRTGEDTELYSIETFHFHENAGLYFVLETSDDCPKDFIEIFEKTVEILGEIGIGAKKSTGLGRFEISKDEDYDNIDNCSEFSKKFFGVKEISNPRYMVLSSYLPTVDEIKELKKENDFADKKSYYHLTKSSGFVSNPSYSDNPEKRNQVYMIVPGSVLHYKPEGQVIDLRPSGGENRRHSIYRPAMPIVVEVSI